MAKANPPPNIPIPDKFLRDPDTRDYFESRDFIQFQIWKKIGGGDDLVEESNQFVTKSQAQINQIREQIGSGDPLTWDETGFSWDSTKQSFDQTEA